MNFGILLQSYSFTKLRLLKHLKIFTAIQQRQYRTTASDIINVPRLKGKYAGCTLRQVGSQQLFLLSPLGSDRAGRQGP